MPKKLRKRRAKYKARSNPTKVLGGEEVVQRLGSPSLSGEKASVVKPQTVMAEQAERYPSTLLELKRAAVIAGSLFLILIVLRFFLH